MYQNHAPTYDPKSTNALLYPSAKIAGAVLLATMALLGVSPVGATISGFFNQEGTAANAFQAGTWETQPTLSTTSPPLELTFSNVEVVDPVEDTPPPEDVVPPAEPVVTLSEVQVVDPPPAETPKETAPTE